MAAPQPLHIFQKDALHLWPETLATLLFFVAFAWAVPFGWRQSEYTPYISLLAGLLHVLMPIAWLVLISRLIHDEPLVGDRQFWTSRPYHWASLLAAKVLYLLVFLYLPFFLMQVYLLRHAGLYPTTVIPALLHNLLLLTIFLVLPITVLAAVTSTFPRLLLSFLGAIVYILIAGGLYAYLIFTRMPPPHFTVLLETLVVVLPLLALVYQYATRKTTVARGILLATPLLVILILGLTPAGALIRGAYPLAHEADVPRLTAVPDPFPPGNIPTGELRKFHADVVLSLPFKVENADQQSNYAVQGVATSLDGGGTHWRSSYQTALGEAINGAQPFTVFRVTVPPAIFNKVHDTPVDLHLSVVTEHVKLNPPSTWKSSLLPFSIPGHGRCFYPDAADAGPDAGPTCRFPLRTPDLLFVTAPLAAGSCAAGPGGQAPQQVPGRQSLANSTSSLNFDPVLLEPLSLQTGDPNPQHRYQFCAGTPLGFIEATPAGRTRFELDQKQVTLNPYALRQERAGVQAVPSSSPE